MTQSMANRIIELLKNADLRADFKRLAPLVVQQYSEKNGVTSYFDFLEK